MTNDVVWISRAMNDSTRTKFFDSEIELVDRGRVLAAVQARRRGEWVDPADLPKRLFYAYRDKKVRKVTGEFIGAGSNWLVSRPCADVLRRLDLGRTTLHPVAFFEHDQVTPVEADYEILNFGEVKAAFMAEESPKFNRPDDMPYHRPPFDLKDGDTALRAEVALEGPDLWLDLQIRGGLFLSDRLAQALRAAKLTRTWGLRKCRVV